MKPADNPSGIVFDIQHFSVHDGPGVRSTVFLKGCPLTCRWCSNPESQRHQPELLHFGELCTLCGICVEECPNDALAIAGDELRRDEAACKLCGLCVSVCPQDARQLSGHRMTVEEVSTEVRQHWRIFMQSGGGVTLSGGEVLAQPAFAGALLSALHDDLGFHTCVDTTGFLPWENFERLLPAIDLILLDLKHMDDARHREATGIGNARILENARRLGERGFPVIVRLPLISAYNDTDENLHALGAFMKKANLGMLEILPYHEFGVSKYSALGKTYTVLSRKVPRSDTAADILGSYGLDVTVARR
ncbi:glycyl radical-activating protein [Rhodomicrobium udaipurense JA643]|uniref:Glycyl-radical enzyme activating protein n=1 Tax=Rhodomicrobium udaipurense TaxID=1202716 RepID=A0A8I1GFG9_9HYPH|nr:glycyl-radical enzyme activating protein [Rhodomicrobium udaipurense]KAI95522.1 glycyl radical-activating protein [Rhodomicrobium udaipurense JA643]MBJ7542781.1 glycyl-radical enzyme activating protein [Rhodomicrobium udaipurense]